MTTIEKIKIILNNLQITYKGSSGPPAAETKGSCICNQPSCEGVKDCSKFLNKDDCNLKSQDWCKWNIPVPPKDNDGCYGKVTNTLSSKLTGLWYAPDGASCMSNIPSDSGTTIQNYNFGIAFLYGALPSTMFAQNNPKPDSLRDNNSANTLFPSNPSIRALNFGGGVGNSWSKNEKDIIFNEYLPYLQIGGYNGMSFDLEYIDSTFTSEILNEIFSQCKKCGFHVSITCGSRGIFSDPADWSAVDINNIDVIIPQFYDGTGITFSDDYITKCSNAWLDTTQTMKNRATWTSDPYNTGSSSTWQLSVLPPKDITADKLARGLSYTQYGDTKGGNKVDILNYNVGPFKAGNIAWCVKNVG